MVLHAVWLLASRLCAKMKSTWAFAAGRRIGTALLQVECPAKPFSSVSLKRLVDQSSGDICAPPFLIGSLAAFAFALSF